ncbi:Uncharacterised protein [Mycobacterium tuberculosis]|uniref:Uncharacterized protein n=1 Tax=Mycobacterium tuberculosis TaxID=1773 RepID=A0A655C1Y6_MYCTX|nr:Uncharacterised protein [Mycobacterium tuberculosis]CKT73501.1 Uncharacterised protein [Mycobacterium tuberculosis]CKV06772.1 Uncharacterised protein [Mycobacterium tuberculosis]CNH61045.1 Uncharacterised protein [Mycobacterium tuberculosis]CNT92310.1 Uncharacterised protein [Mycobacterium tuberculosis]
MAKRVRADVGCSHGNDGATVIDRHETRSEDLGKVRVVGLGTEDEVGAGCQHALQARLPDVPEVRVLPRALRVLVGQMDHAIEGEQLPHPCNALGARNRLCCR